MTGLAQRLAAGLLGAWLVMALLDPSRAAAHAVLLRSIPSGSQTLAQPPRQVELLFSEPIDAVFSSVSVLDATGQAVDQGDSHVDADDDHRLVVSLPPGLPNGTYTVAWRSLSTIDVHPDEGRYRLFVGVPVATAGALTPQSLAPTPFTATPATTFGRWWFYLAASLFGGVLATWKLVLSGLLVGEHASLRPAARRVAQRVIVLGGLALIAGTLFAAIAQAAAAANVPLLDGIGRPLADLLLRGRFATIWWPRLGLELASLLLVVFGGLEGMAAESALATLPAVLLTSSLTSHGAALPGASGPGIAIDFLHILGATAWVGGLIGLLALLPTLRDRATTERTAVVPPLLGRFGRYALVAAVLVLLSGSLQAVLEIGSWSALLDSTYGQLVVLKIGLLAGMLGLAAANTWRGRRGQGALRRGVRVELGLGVVVLVVAAVLTGTPPARGALPTSAVSSAPSAAARGGAAWTEAAAAAAWAAGWPATPATSTRTEAAAT